MTQLLDTRTAPATFAAWLADLEADGLTVLGAHRVPVQLWLLDVDGSALHLRAAGTRVVLRRYAGGDLTALVLRAECDCAEHRAAGARTRLALDPAAVPVEEAVFDGATLLGWRGVEAGLVDVRTAAAVLEDLLGVLAGSERRRTEGTRGPAPWENHRPPALEPVGPDLTPANVRPRLCNEQRTQRSRPRRPGFDRS